MILAKPYWDYGEAALVLNIDVKTLQNKKCKRELTYTKFGRKIYFSRDQVMRELRLNTVLCPKSAMRRAGRPAPEMA
jgi:hypothetical protein